jgi:hypothetical protein
VLSAGFKTELKAVFQEHRCLELTLQLPMRLLNNFVNTNTVCSIKIGADSTDLRAESTEVGVASENLATDNADLGANCVNPGAVSENLELKVRSLS